jgi:hypothetical protein
VLFWLHQDDFPETVETFSELNLGWDFHKSFFPWWPRLPHNLGKIFFKHGLEEPEIYLDALRRK